MIIRSFISISINSISKALSYIFVIFCINSYAGTTQLQIATQHFPPLQSRELNGQSGYVHQLMQEAIKRVNKIYPINIKSYNFLPWKRALIRAKSMPNVLFYSLSRTPQRESQYQWLGKVSIYQKSLFKLKSKRFDVTSLKQLKTKNLRLSVQNGGATHSYLDNLGLELNKDFRTYIKYPQGIKQLFSDRVDLIPLNPLTAKNSACKLGLDGEQLVAAFSIEELSKPLWAVLSNGTDPILVELFRTAIEKIHSEGLSSHYYKEHMADWNTQPCKI
ncbi:MAG: ABC transporter substrate-binding protein [Oceanospirillaceae bacterium]